MFSIIIATFIIVATGSIRTGEIIVPVAVGLGMSIIEIFMFICSTKLMAIIFNNDEVILKLSSIFKKTRVAIKIENLQYSYDPEVGVRGIKSEEMRLYENGKKIIGFGRSYDGWSTTKVLEIHRDLIRLNVSRYK